MTKKNNIEVEFIETNSQKLDTVLSNPEYAGAFIHVHDNGDSDADDMLYIGEDRVTDNLNTRDENLSTPTRKIGGLNESTIGDLKKRSMSEIIIDMLKADKVNPVIEENPSISLTYSGPKLISVGDVIPEQNMFTVTSRSGKWSDGTPYWGDCSTSFSTVKDDEFEDDYFGSVSEEGTYKITLTGTFGPGGTPKNNYGEDCEKSNGGVKTSVVKIIAVHPIYINSGQTITENVEYVVDYINGVEFDVVIPPEQEIPVNIKFMVNVPEQFNTFIVKQFNPISNQYDIPIDMSFKEIGGEFYYIRSENSTKTSSAKYKINLKK